MKLIRNLERFPFGIRQPWDQGWCIPASIEVVTKYHSPNTPVTQPHIVDEYVRQTKRPADTMGLESITDVLRNDSMFNWANKNYLKDSDFHGAFAELAQFLEESVSESKPPIVSIPVAYSDGKWNGWHMYVVVGYDETFFRVYDPNPMLQAPWHDVPKFTIQGNLYSKKEKERIDSTDTLLLFPTKVDNDEEKNAR